MKQLMSGNEAIARGLYEGGFSVCSAYPGTPSTEVMEELPKYKDDIYAEWAPNEKVAAEVAWGACVGGVRSFCAMKMVGLNVAADPVFSASYRGVKGAYVIMTADDPSMHSSQNEQDNRHYARAAKIPMIEPSDSQECKDFMAAAAELSERFDTPVLFRTTTRIDHSKSIVELGERKPVEGKGFAHDPAKFNCTPACAIRQHPQVEKRTEALKEYGNDCIFNRIEMSGTKIGVIAAGVSYQYAKEVFPEDTSFLKLGLTWPLPEKLIREFAAAVDDLYVIEELDPFLEDQIHAMGIPCKGKELTGMCYELNTELLRERIFGSEPTSIHPDKKLANRPPALCAGCPHRGFFYTIGRDKSNIVCGDIGCYTLGGAAPLGAMDTSLCMGGGLTVAMGISKALEAQGDTSHTVFGVVGDSTFFHSGMTGAAEIAYNGGKVIPVVLDNRITGMTGHQENPGTGYSLEGEQTNIISIEAIMRSYGFMNVIVVDPQDLGAMQRAVDAAKKSTVPACIICRRPCVLIKRLPRSKFFCRVDPDKCRTCKSCLKAGCPAISIKDGKAAIAKDNCTGCTVCSQICPFGAISREVK